MIAPPFLVPAADEWTQEMLRDRVDSFRGWLLSVNNSHLSRKVSDFEDRFDGAILAIAAVTSSTIPQTWVILSGLFALFGFMYNIYLLIRIGTFNQKFVERFFVCCSLTLSYAKT
jgi:hypothetical protein